MDSFKNRYLILLLFITIAMLNMQSQEPLFERLQLEDDLEGSRGVSIADLDGNGQMDLVIANEVDSTRLLGNSIYFQENNDFRKTAIAANDIRAWSESAHTVDVDNDHDMDLFFTTQFGAPNLLYYNDGYGNFTRGKLGDLVTDATNSPGACWCDYDLDGDLDVFVVNRDGTDDELYVNNGRGIFNRLKSGPWTHNAGDGRSCAWGDLDGDGWPDLYVVNFVHKKAGIVQGKHRNYLYLNAGDGSFEEERKGIHVEELHASYGVSLIDYDYDGDLDIYVTNVSVADENAFYENRGGGLFTKKEGSEISFEIRRPSKGQAWADYDNDGRLDVYVANGTEGYPEIQNFFFLGGANHSFRRVYNTLPAIEGHISAGTAAGDLNNDGSLDIYVCNWGSDAEANDCYINLNKENHWIKLQLKGEQSNSYGIGSWVFLKTKGGQVQTRYFNRETGYGSENAPEVHFGLGPEVEISEIEIRWPSGVTQSAMNLEVNTTYQVIEGRAFNRIDR